MADQWERLFWEVARALNCLPSSFVDGNAHVIRAAQAKTADRCPWPDHDGWPIFHGSRMWHPATGQTFTAIRLQGVENPGDAWRAVYDADPEHLSRLGLQIGDKGRAVVVRPAKEGAPHGTQA